MSAVLENQEIRIRGMVQGVGFHPAVYRLALECQLSGEVFSEASDVLIRLTGIRNDIKNFLQRLEKEASSFTKIVSIETRVVTDIWCYRGFSISKYGRKVDWTGIAADAASCKECLAEVADPHARRYLYPFANCVYCGPRLSIIRGIPCDRVNSTMDIFDVCEYCRTQYSNPLDRHFQSQFIACHDCGPKLLLHSNKKNVPVMIGSNREQTRHALQYILQALDAGKIIAIKGLGGFHLCCDASNHDAVTSLRLRKQCHAKPFALMCSDTVCIERYCELSDVEKNVLQSAAAPIVLLQKKVLPSITLSNSIAPGSNLLGCMLPHMPLHHLISQQFSGPLAITSSNLSGEPQIIDNHDAIKKLGTIADLIIYHNRPIANPIDDSVVRCVGGKMRILRRARGYVPASITLPDGFQSADNILAYGAELTSSFCLLKQGSAILSQHHGDFTDIAVARNYEKNLALYKTLFDFKPQHLVFAKHSEYLSGKLIRQDAQEQQLPALAIQQYHAHVASAMAENNIALEHPKVLGIVLDGLGVGESGNLWGGEFLLADYCSYQRVAYLAPIAMPDGALVIGQPWRSAWAHIANAMSWEAFTEKYNNTTIAHFLHQQSLPALHDVRVKKNDCTVSSSAGLLFDAVAAAAGLCTKQIHFEGQSAIELEMHADAEAVLTQRVTNPYPFMVNDVSVSGDMTSSDGLPPVTLSAEDMWPELLNDLQQGESTVLVSSRFHAGFISGIIRVVDILHERFHFTDVVLSGRCMQNAILLQGLEQALVTRNLRCVTHAQVPANDGGVALGQAVIAAARIIKNDNTQ